jgi:hypothetical protein
MVYPKPYMKRRELVRMGIPGEMLDRAYRSKGQRFAQKMNPAKVNSPILFETEGFERWRIKQMNIEQRGRL